MRRRRLLVAAGGLGLLALEPSWSSLFAVELAIVGVGIGAFTPPNNASIMNAAPREQSASAGGTINLTRGLGTSLGLTLTALVFGLVAGSHVDPASAETGTPSRAAFRGEDGRAPSVGDCTPPSPETAAPCDLHAHRGRRNVARMASRVICISRAHGARGDEVGKLVAERLGFRYVDEEIVAQAAAIGGISPADVADEERRKSALGKLFRELGRGRGFDSYGVPQPRPHMESPAPADVKGLIQAAIEETAGRGDVVIVAHAASFALPRSPNVLRVFVTATPEARARRLTDSFGFDPDTSQKAIRESDAARGDYLKRFYGVDTEQATHYDLVVNTGSLTLDRAADLVVRAAGG